MYLFSSFVLSYSVVHIVVYKAFDLGPPAIAHCWMYVGYPPSKGLTHNPSIPLKNPYPLISTLPLYNLKSRFLHIPSYSSRCSSHSRWLYIDFRHFLAGTQYCDFHPKGSLAVSQASQVPHTSHYCCEQSAVSHWWYDLYPSAHSNRHVLVFYSCLCNIPHSRDICAIIFAPVSQVLAHTYYLNIFAPSLSQT